MTSPFLIRPFRNDDPPALQELWESQPAIESRAQVVTLDVLDRLVFAKSYFDRCGLLLAEHDGRIEGLVHAALAPSDDGRGLDHSQGVICALILRDPQRVDLGVQLLDGAEAYLVNVGASVVWGGGYSGGVPFYLGICGNSPWGGVPAEDQPAREAYAQAGYTPCQDLQGWRQSLAGFRAPVNREQMSIRRRYEVDCDNDPQPGGWWDACLLGPHDRRKFRLTDKTTRKEAARVEFWDLEPLASSWNVRAIGLLPVTVQGPASPAQLGLFLVAEALRQFGALGFAAVETTLPADADSLDGAIVRDLKFSPLGQASIFHKSLRQPGRGEA